ncbi:MAG: M23 family metallopeptidase [Syntrophaceae bacterium]|nr:M23 family metallopeptidase [Syntrophaceae bacterium]
MKKSILIASVLLLSLWVGSSFAAQVTLFGPNQYSRSTGKPNVYSGTFPGIAGQGKLIIKNGDTSGNNRVSSALIFVNGNQILGPNSFNQQIYNIEVPLSIAQNNSISVELRSKPGSYLILEVTEEVDADAGAVVGANGAIITTPDDRSTIVIPEGSLASACVILIEELTSPLFHKVYSFSPSGLSFSKPVQIIFGYDPTTLSPGVNEADLYLAVLNDNFEIVEILQDSIVDIVTKTVTATITHFSNFALGSPTNFSNVSPPAASDLLSFRDPVNNVIWGQSYNNLWAPYGYHTGRDITGDEHIRATGFGKVLTVQPNDCTSANMGNTVIIEHYLANAKVIYSLYAHMNSVSVQRDQWLKQGGEIGIMGGTAGCRALGPWPVHLHFEMKDRNVLNNPSGNGLHWGYTPANPDLYGYHNPNDYFDKRDTQVAFLAKAEGSIDVFWIQNGKKYHVLPGIIEKMSSLPTWGWGKVATYPSDVINQFEFHQRNFIEPNTNSDGLLIREINTSEVYLVENGRKRHITSIDEFNQMSLDWNDIIVVTHDIISLLEAPPPPPGGPWLSFVEGNPGIPGDGVFINASFSSGYYYFELSNPISLGLFPDGFTYIIFPPSYIENFGAALLHFTNKIDSGSCIVRIILGYGVTPTGKVAFNGVEGFITSITTSTIQYLLDSVNQFWPGCSTTVNNLFLYRFSLVDNSMFSITTLDAAIILPGQNAVP